MSWSEGSESLSMSLVCSFMLEAEGSSVETVYEHSGNMIRFPRVVILSIPSSNMSIAILDLIIENQKGEYIKHNRNISLNTVFHEWHLYCLQVAPCLF